MKLLTKVVWSEGMYLAPHHFQAQNRYFENSVHFATSALWRDSYGIDGFEIVPDALRNGIVALAHARGIFQDGLVFEMPEGDPLPEPVNITDLFPPQADHLVVCLAVPKWVPNGQNCETSADSQSRRRYIAAPQSLADENTGSDAKPVPLGRKNIRLIVESDSTEEMLTLPILRLVRDGSSQFALDPTFIPPCLRLSASARLMSILRRLVEVLESKGEVISHEQQQTRGKFQAGMSARHVSQFWFLHAINTSLTPLRHLLLSKHGHPQELFLEMSRLGGALCTFGLNVHPSSLPTYDHMRLDHCFGLLDDHIRQHLDIVAPSQAVVIPLKPVGQYYYEGDVIDERCLGRSQWIFAIRAKIGEAELIVRARKLVKVCSAKFVPELVKRAVPGLEMSHLPVPPSSVSAKVEYQYFSLSRTGPCWEHIMQSHRVGVYVPSELPMPELELVVILEG